MITRLERTFLVALLLLAPACMLAVGGQFVAGYRDLQALEGTQFTDPDGRRVEIVAVVRGHAIHRGRLLVVCATAGEDPLRVMVMSTREQVDRFCSRVNTSRITNPGLPKKDGP